jgi:hypothetical protein
MNKLITVDVAANIASHCEKSWTYSLPNSDTGENIIMHGLSPFYPKTEKKGGSTTIVDLKIDNIAYDIKCRQVLTITAKSPKKSKNKKYVKFDGQTIIIPNSVETPVRRPNVNLQEFTGDCQLIINEQIQEYKDYADRTMKAANCTDLHSVLLLYGEGNGYKAIYIDEQLFDTPAATRFETYLNKKKIPSAYLAYDDIGLLYKLMDYSKGSTNFVKRFDCSNGFLFMWKDVPVNPVVTTIEQWQNKGNHILKID